MKKKSTFGIISGAGPIAGALLYKKVIEILQSRGYWQDADFPKILLFNYPFSDMLNGDVFNSQVREELFTVLDALKSLVDYVYIACQTLHSFLSDDDINEFKVVSLLDLINQNCKDTKAFLIVASKTSRIYDLHTKKLNRTCEYIEPDLAENAINMILQGKNPDLRWLEEYAKNHSVILGCTEFSVALEKSESNFLDPIKLAAEDIVQKFLSHDY